MTDDEAKRDLERAVKWGIFGSPPSVETMRYALQAVEDRAHFADIADEVQANAEYGTSRLMAMRVEARQHMRGE